MARYSDEELISATLAGSFDDSPGKDPELRKDVRRDLRHVKARLAFVKEDWDVMTEADLLVLLKILTEALAEVNRRLWIRQRQSLSKKKRGAL